MERDDLLVVPDCCVETALSGKKAECPRCGRKINNQIRDKAPLIQKYKADNRRQS